MLENVVSGEELTRSYDEPMQDYLLYQEPPTQEPLDCSLVDYLRNKADSLPFHHRHRISFNESADSGDDSATFSEDNSLSHDYDITRRFSIVSFSSVSSAAYVTADEAGSETTLDYFSPNEDLISADDFFSPDSEHYLSQGDLRMKSLPPPSDDNLFCPRPLTPTLMMSSPNMMTSPFQITAFDTITNQSSSDEMLTADSGGETPVPQLDSDDDDVIKPLLFVSGVRDVSATIGTNVELSCTVECQPTPRVIWYKNNQKIPQTEKVANRFLTEIKRENKNQFKISLTVHDVKPDDGGEYMMAVTTAGGNLFSSGSLIIGSSLDSKPHAKYELMREIPSSVKYSSPQTGTPKVFPPSFDDITDDVECNIGDSATFRVTVLGNPPPVVSWYKDNVLLNEGEIERIDEGNQHSIIIHDVTHERSGIYSCTASSIAGHVTCKAELEAKLEPDWSKSDETSLQISKRRFKDNYKVDDIIGRGVISLVKRATHRVTNHTVAAKFIQNKHKDHITAQNEIDILTKCQHNHIVKFYESFTTSRHMIIVTEICKIELFEFFVTSQSFCEAMVSRYMKQLCEAISYLHRNNILHLNVKPENILLDENSTLKLINFGSAHRMNEDSVIYWNRGTPEFVAPEVVTSCQVTTGTDMWSVGVVTYLALTGVSPFAGETDQMTLFRIRDFDEKLNFKHFHQISESGKDFVSMLIVMSQSSRLSADDVINHEWMASSVEKKLETERLKYFQSRRKWQRSLLTGKSTLTIRSMTSLLHGEYGSTSLAVPRHVIDDVTSSTTVTESEDEEPPLVPRPNPTPTIQISSPLTSPAVERREIFKAGRSLSGSMERPLQLKEDRSKPPEGRRLDLLQVGKKQVSFEEKVDIVTSSDDNVFDDVIKEPQENNESKQHHLVGRSEPETKRKKKTNTRVVRHRSFDVPVSSSDEETSEVRGKEGVSHHVTPHKGKLGVPHASTEIRGKEGNPSPPRCSIKRRIWGRAASLDSEHGGIPKPRKGILKKGNSTDSETSGNQKFRPLKTGDEKYPDVGNYKRKVIRKVNTLPGSGAPPSSPLSSISSVTRRRQMMVRGLSVDSAIRPSMVKGGLRGPLFEQRHHNDDSDVTTAGAMMRGSPLQNRSFSPLRGNTPDPPIISRVVGADVWVRWSPSHCDSAQISYRLEMQSHGSSSWKIVAENIKSTSYHVIGLDRRLSYVFRVAATTSGQYGVFSQPSQNVSFMKKR